MKKKKSVRKKAAKKVSKDTAKKKPVKKRKTAKKASKKKAMHARPKSAADVCTSYGDDSMRRAAYAGVAALFLSVIIAYMGIQGIETKARLFFYLAFMVIAVFFSIVYLLGFARLGKLAKDSILRNAAYMFVALTVIDMCYLLIITTLKRPEHHYAAVVFLFFYGAIAIMFGKGIWDLKDRLGRLAKMTGVLNMIAGLLTLSFFISEGIAGFGVLLALFTEVLNILILLRSSRIYA